MLIQRIEVDSKIDARKRRRPRKRRNNSLVRVPSANRIANSSIHSDLAALSFPPFLQKFHQHPRNSCVDNRLPSPQHTCSVNPAQKYHPRCSTSFQINRLVWTLWTCRARYYLRNFLFPCTWLSRMDRKDHPSYVDSWLTIARYHISSIGKVVGAKKFIESTFPNEVAIDFN